MAKDTLIRFTNSTGAPLAIKPVNSSIGKFERFSLEPGESRSLKGSNPGAGNYDLEWDPIVNPRGKVNDLLLGTLRADNPFNKSPYMESLASETWFASSGKNFQTSSFDIRAYSSFYEKRITAGDESIFYYGDADQSVMVRGKRTVKVSNPDSPGLSSRKELDFLYTAGFLDAMNRDLPIAKISYLGLVDGSYAWSFDVGYF